MSAREEVAASRFRCSVKERAIFESGIKLGTIYHQFVGTPVSIENVEMLERSIEDAISVQPFVKDVKVSIDRSNFTRNGDTYSYSSLTGDMIDAVVKIEIESITVTSEMRYDKELRYPLMFVSEVVTK